MRGKKAVIIVWAMMLMIAGMMGNVAQAEGKAEARAIVRATKVTLPKAKTIYLGKDKVGSKATLKYEILPENAAALGDVNLQAWSSANTAVAKVSDKGVVTATGLGTTYITLHLEDGSAKQARCKVTVKKQPVTGVKLSQTRVSLLPGMKYQLKATLQPKNAYGSGVTWRSSDPSKAKVSKDGLVSCKKPGTVQISCKSKTGKGEESCTFLIGYNFEESFFRFVSIANAGYPDTPGARPGALGSSAALFEYYDAMYSEGMAKNRRTYENLTGAQMRNVLKEMSGWKATEKDVTILHFAGRGEITNVKKQKGALLGVDANKAAGVVTIAEVQSYLDKIQGTIILLLDSDMSGQFVTSKGAELDFGAVVIEEIAERQAQVRAIGGEKRSKYKIITACTTGGRAYEQWDEEEEDGFSFLTEALVTGFEEGADTNRDNIVTVREAYNFASRKVAQYVSEYNRAHKTKRSQKVTLWPAGDYSPLCVISAETDGDMGDE